MKIGEVSRRTGVTVEAIRYYERLGLVPEAPRTSAGYRRFDRSAVRRVRFIRRAQELGFSLAETGELLELRRAASSRAADVRALAAAKLASIESKIADLDRIHRALFDVTRRCPGDGSLGECPILDALDGLEEGEAFAPSGSTRSWPPPSGRAAAPDRSSGTRPAPPR